MYLLFFLLTFFWINWILNKFFTLFLYLLDINNSFFDIVDFKNMFAILLFFIMILFISISPNISKNLKYLKLEINRIVWPNKFLILIIVVDILSFIFFITIVLLSLDILFLNFTNFFYK